MTRLFHFPFRAMGSPCQLYLYAANPATAERIARRVQADALGIETRYSRYRPDSLLSRINQVAATGGTVEVDAETAGLLDYAATCYHESDGLFDITSGVLREVWNFQSGRLPNPAEIAALLPRIGWDKVVWARPRLSFPVAGMQLDFGGIGKEYAADRAANLCLEQGIRHGLVDFGGDIAVIGPHPDGSPWPIGIQHPFQPEAVLATVALTRGALASSGDYERRIEIAGRRYGHILNPKTGWPAQGLAAVSVVASHGLIAGSACTIAMLKGRAGIAWLEALGLPHLWMDDTGRAGGPLIEHA